MVSTLIRIGTPRFGSVICRLMRNGGGRGSADGRQQTADG
jgi:hypothetical protein